MNYLFLPTSSPVSHGNSSLDSSQVSAQINTFPKSGSEHGNNPYGLQKLRGLALHAVEKVPSVYLPQITIKKRPRPKFANQPVPSPSKKLRLEKKVDSAIQIVGDQGRTCIPLSPPKKIKPCHLLTRGLKTEQFGYALKENASPKTRAFMKRTIGSPLKVLKYNANGSPEKVYKQNGDELVKLKLSMKANGAVGSIYAYSSLKHSRPRDAYNECNKSTIAAPFKPITRFSGSIVLTKERLAEFEGVRKKWRTNQTKVMGMSAKRAAFLAGVKVKCPYHWLHLLAFTMGGFDGVEPNEYQNLIVGTEAANGRHLVLEEIAKSFVTEHGIVVVRYEIDPQQQIKDEKWHLFGEFKYEIYGGKPEMLSDFLAGKKSADEIKDVLLMSEIIDTLDPGYPHKTDQEPLQKYAQRMRERAVESIDQERLFSDIPTVPNKAKSNGQQLKRKRVLNEIDNSVSKRRLNF